MAFPTCTCIRVDKEFPEPRVIAHAVAVMELGGVVAYPTDTNYGIGCAMSESLAIDRMIKLKNLPAGHLFSLICPDLSDIARYAVLENDSYRILKRHLPGPYTFILRATPEVPRVFRSNRQTVGIRIPDMPVTTMLARYLRRPIVSTTASLHEVVFKNGDEILRRFGHGLDLILDGGPVQPKDSTVVDLSGPYPIVVRAGAGDLSGLVV